MRTLLLIFALAYTAIGQSPECPGNYTAVGTGCYTFPDLGYPSWIVSNTYCQYSGGYLVNINNEAEQMALEEFHVANYPDVWFRWIGATDMVVNGTWRWVPSGESVVYNLWHSLEPALDCSYWSTLYHAWFNRDCCTREDIQPICEADPL